MNSIPQKKKKMGTIVLQLAMKVVSSSEKNKAKKEGIIMLISVHRDTKQGEDKLRPITW